MNNERDKVLSANYFPWRYIPNKKHKITLVKIQGIIIIASILPLPSLIAALLIGTSIDGITGWGKNFDNWAQVSIPSQMLAYSMVILIPIVILRWVFF